MITWSMNSAMSSLLPQKNIRIVYDHIGFWMLRHRFSMPWWSSDDPWIKTNIEKYSSHEQIMNIRCFLINDHLKHEFSHGSYLVLKISLWALIGMTFTATALLGCSFVARRGPKSMSLVPGIVFPKKEYMKIYFHKSISWKIFLEIHFRKLISRNRFPSIYFWKYFYGSTFP